MMATEYIQARVMKSGMERLIMRRKLQEKRGIFKNCSNCYRTYWKISIKQSGQACNVFFFFFTAGEIICHLFYSIRFICSAVEYLHIIYITWIRHLLDVNTSLLFGPSNCSDNAVINYILKVSKSSPNIPQILKRISPGTGIPIPANQKHNKHVIS